MLHIWVTYSFLEYPPPPQDWISIPRTLFFIFTGRGCSGMWMMMLECQLQTNLRLVAFLNSITHWTIDEACWLLLAGVSSSPGSSRFSNVARRKRREPGKIYHVNDVGWRGLGRAAHARSTVDIESGPYVRSSFFI